MISQPVRRLGFSGFSLVFALLAGAAFEQGASSQCTVNSSPRQFHPNGNPLGYGPAGHFTSGFATSIALYSGGTSNRLILRENYGYTTYDLSNPTAPVASGAQDIEHLQGTWAKAGDGFSTITTATASADGSRALVGTRTIRHGTLLMKPNGAIFEFGGEFNPSSAGSLAVDKLGSRYIAYALFGSGSNALRVADVTNFVGAPNFDVAGSIAGETVPGLRAGNNLIRAGHFLVYSTGDSIVVVDGNAPGPVGNIVSGLSVHTFTMSDFGLSNSDYAADFAAAMHPTDGKLYIMVHTKSPSTTISTGVGVGRTANGVGMSIVGSKVTLSGQWGSSIPTYYSGAMVAMPQDLLIFSWTHVTGATGTGNDNKLFTWSAANWGTDLTPNLVVKSTSYIVGSSSIFPAPVVMTGFSQGSQVNLYIGTGEAAFSQSLTCTTTITPEVYLSVNGSSPGICGGSGAGNTCTVYLGDSLTAYAYVNGSPDPATFQSWVGTGASPAGGTGPIFSFGYSATGSNTLTLNGYSAPFVMPIDVSALPPLLLTTSADAQSVQPDQVVTFTATPSGGVGTITTTWDFGDGMTGTGTSVTHSYAAPGSYLATATARTSRSTTASSVPITVARIASGFFVLNPCRMLDTRDPAGPRGGPSIAPLSARQFPATGVCGIPSTARALVGNLTVVNPATPGELRAYSGDVLPPLATVVPFVGGIVRGNNLVLRLSVSGGGNLAIRNESTGAVDVLLDVSGYFQ